MISHPMQASVDSDRLARFPAATCMTSSKHMLPAATFQARSLMALVNLLPPENLQYVNIWGSIGNCVKA